MAGFEFVPATKAASKARIALLGTAGAGKTYTALRLAAGLDRGESQLGLIDTDRESARKYADLFSFHWLGMNSFNPDDLTKATIAAARQGIGALIIDTASPFWSGADGMLDRVGQASSSFEGWRQMRPLERRMFDALLSYPGHVIVTLRVKTEYVVETNDKGKAEPRRIGLKPEQREGMEHEFDVVLDLDDAGQIARVVKTRCPELASRAFRQPGEDVGQIVQAWLDRAAVGEVLNPQDIRDFAFECMDGLVPDAPDVLAQIDGVLLALRERRDALAAVGQLDAVVQQRDEDVLVGIGVLLTEQAVQLQNMRKAWVKRQEAARRQEAQQQAAVNGAGR